MIVISDTSPINYLILIDEIGLLPKLYGRVIVASGVLEELVAGSAPEKVKRWLAEKPNWLEVREPVTPLDEELTNSLDLGESQSIQLASDLGADLLVIDERPGREMALKRGLKVIGTVGILVQAAENDLADLENVVSKLEKTNFYISRSLKEYIREQIET